MQDVTILNILLSSFINLGLIGLLWRYTYIRLDNNVRKLKDDFENEKEKNIAFRHEYKGVTDNIWNHITSEIKLVSQRLEAIPKLERAIDNLAKTISNMKR